MSTGLRLMSFFVRKLTITAAIVLLIVLTSFIAYDMANIYVVVNDGLTQRSETILNRGNPADLNRFFTLKYLNSDPLFHSDQYRDYIINDYDYELKITKVWVWPWQSRTSIVVEESISDSSWKFKITDEMRQRLTEAQMSDSEEAAEGDAATEVSFVIPNPQWQNGEKLVEFRKVDGKWKIDRVVFLRSIQPDKASKSKTKQ